MTAITPVFLTNSSIPDSDSNRMSGLDLCLAGERTAGQGGIIGAQQIRGLWRIYPASRNARNELLLKGLTVRDCVLQVCDSNPFVVRGGNGVEKPTTKVWVADLPLSVANSEIEHSLNRLGCEIRSAIKQERYRDSDNKLTRFETGRRFLFITIPSEPLETTLKIGIFNAKIFHKEQKEREKVVICSKCLQRNHHASVCPNEVICRACNEPGHKQGSEQCKIVENREIENPQEDMPRNNRKPVEGEKEEDLQNQAAGNSRDDIRERRGREKRQTTLHSSLTRLGQRQRSQTPKRRRSGDEQEDRRKKSMDKQARRERGGEEKEHADDDLEGSDTGQAEGN